MTISQSRPSSRPARGDRRPRRRPELQERAHATSTGIRSAGSSSRPASGHTPRCGNLEAGKVNSPLTSCQHNRRSTNRRRGLSMQSKTTLRRSRRPRPRQRPADARRRAAARDHRTVRSRPRPRPRRNPPLRGTGDALPAEGLGRPIARSSPSAWRSAATRRRRSSACWRATRSRSPRRSSAARRSRAARPPGGHRRDRRRAPPAHRAATGLADRGRARASPDRRRGGDRLPRRRRRRCARRPPNATATPSGSDRRPAVPAGRVRRRAIASIPGSSSRLDRPARLAADGRDRHAAAGRAATPGSANRLDRAFRSILSAAQIVGFARSGQRGAIDRRDRRRPRTCSPTSSPPARRHERRAARRHAEGAAPRRCSGAAGLPAGQPGRPRRQAFFPLSDLYAGMEPAVAETLCEAWRDGASRTASRGTSRILAENGDRRRGGASRSRPARQRRGRPSRPDAPDQRRLLRSSRGTSRPSRSSTATIQRSGSKRISRSSLRGDRSPGCSSSMTRWNSRSLGRDFVERRLRRRPVEIGGAVQPVDDDEDRAGLLGAAPRDRRDRALGVAAADEGPDPEGRGDAHQVGSAGLAWRRSRPAAR